MIIVKEGAVWPPQPEEVEFSHGSQQELEHAYKYDNPAWARVTELGAKIGAFLGENMDVSASTAIGNKLTPDVDLRYKAEFMLGVRNGVNIITDQMIPEGSLSRIAIHEGSLVEVGA